LVRILVDVLHESGSAGREAHRARDEDGPGVRWPNQGRETLK